MHTTALV